MSRTVKRWVHTFAVASLVGLSLAGCGGGDDEEPGTVAPGATAGETPPSYSEETIAKFAKNAGVSVKEAKEALVYLERACDTGYDVATMNDLTKEQQELCDQLAEIKAQETSSPKATTSAQN